MNKVVVTLLAVMVAASGSAFAKGDVAAGKAKAVGCVNCHGSAGVSSNYAWPSLAGQGYTYHVNQLRAYREGMRKNDLMEAIAKALSDEDIENLAAYYATQTPTVAASTAVSKGDVAAGEARAVGCAKCHGVTGVSLTDAWPNLAAQGYQYNVDQLRAYRDGTRKNGLMGGIARPLSDQDIENLAAYYATLEPSGVPVEEDALPIPAPAVSAALPHAPIISGDIVVPRPHPTRKYWADKLPGGEGRTLVVQKCQLCHDLQRAIAFARPKEQWQEVLESMIHRGTPLSPEEVPVVVNYLTKNFGPDSAPIPEVGMKACKPSEWPKGSSDFRSNWKGSYNIWVSNQQGNNIDIVDSVTKKIVRRINCINAPDRVEFSRDGNTAYVPSRVEHNLTVIDTRTGAIKKKIPLIARANTAVLSRDFKKLYISIWPVRGDEAERGYVQIVDTATLKVVRTIETPGAIHDTWMSPDGKILLASSPQGKFMNVYDVTQNDKLLYTCCTEASIGTMNIEAAPDGSTSRFFLSYSGFYGIVAIDARTGKEVKRVAHPEHTEGPFKGIKHVAQSVYVSGFHGGEISPDGNNYWVMAGSVVYRYELPSLKYLGDVHLAWVDQSGKPFTPVVEGTWLSISPDGQKVYAARPGRNLLSVIDVTTMKEEALIPTGEYPLHFSIWPRGTP